jgi:hypothetical protein
VLYGKEEKMKIKFGRSVVAALLVFAVSLVWFPVISSAQDLTFNKDYNIIWTGVSGTSNCDYCDQPYCGCNGDFNIGLTLVGWSCTCGNDLGKVCRQDCYWSA